MLTSTRAWSLGEERMVEWTDNRFDKLLLLVVFFSSNLSTAIWASSTSSDCMARTTQLSSMRGRIDCHSGSIALPTCCCCCWCWFNVDMNTNRFMARRAVPIFKAKLVENVRDVRDNDFYSPLERRLKWKIKTIWLTFYEKLICSLFVGSPMWRFYLSILRTIYRVMFCCTKKQQISNVLAPRD